MPRLSHSVPKYRKHRASGQAVVTIAGQDRYLGPYGTKVSKFEYDRLVQEWLVAGRSTVPTAEAEPLTITELISRYWEFAKKYYRKNGEPTGTADNLKPVLRLLRRTYGHSKLDEFGPLALESLQNQMIEAGHSRRYINDNVDRIRRMFRWGVAKELVRLEVSQRLNAVLSLAKGRSDAKETDPVSPVRDAVVEATLPHLSPVVADMVRFQRLTRCRPSEVCIIRPSDVETTRRLPLCERSGNIRASGCG